MRDDAKEASEATPPANEPERTLLQRGLRVVPGGFWEKMGVWRLRGQRGEPGYLSFLKVNPPALAFCFLWILSSGFGQTFFLSTFQPYWLESLGLTTGTMGLIYGAATLCSGLLLQKMGAWVDRVPASRAALFGVLGLSMGAVLMAAAVHWSILFAAIFFMRFSGQGVSSMIGTTSAVRWFSRDQSKAVSLAGLGYPTGEAIFPWLLIPALAFLGWRGTALGVAGIALLALLPLSLLLLSKSGSVVASGKADSVKGKGREKQRSFFLDKRFLVMLLVITPQPFIGTGIIFFQTIISEHHGWPGGTFATGFLIFALTRAACSLFAGAWADKIGPQRLFGLPALVLGIGLLFLMLSHPAAAYVYFLCMGLSFGISSAIVTPTFSSVFGVSRIGEVRGASASVAVFSTALAPTLFGYALEFGVQATTILGLCGALLLLVSWPASIWIRKKFL